MYKKILRIGIASLALGLLGALTAVGQTASAGAAVIGQRACEELARKAPITFPSNFFKDVR
ncbi:MAG TPA: hypothetical protein VMH30_10715 [Verrucomicrobiae bacterium]|nr:hypothetical protein [Verrucomicrobiae bacterium]